MMRAMCMMQEKRIRLRSQLNLPEMYLYRNGNRSLLKSNQSFGSEGFRRVKPTSAPSLASVGSLLGCGIQDAPIANKCRTGLPNLQLYSRIHDVNNIILDLKIISLLVFHFSLMILLTRYLPKQNAEHKTQSSSLLS